MKRRQKHQQSQNNSKTADNSNIENNTIVINNFHNDDNMAITIKNYSITLKDIENHGSTPKQTTNLTIFWISLF